MSTCDCYSGTIGDRDYQIQGSFVKLHGFDAYQTKAPASSKGQILILPDAFGLATHNLILSDRFAAEGFNTTAIDYYEGKALPEILMQYHPGTDLDSYGFTEEERNTIRDIDINQWAKENDAGRIHELLVPFIERLRQDLPSSTPLHIVGHCFGGIQSFLLGPSTLIKSAVVMHPGPYSAEHLKTIKFPILIGLAETDVFAPGATKDIPKAMLGTGIYYKIGIYGGTKHGFASRADFDDDLAMKGYLSSVRDTLDWIRQFSQ